MGRVAVHGNEEGGVVAKDDLPAYIELLIKSAWLIFGTCRQSPWLISHPLISHVPLFFLFSSTKLLLGYPSFSPHTERVGSCIEITLTNHIAKGIHNLNSKEKTHDNYLVSMFDNHLLVS